MESHHQLFIKGGGKRKGILHKGTSIRDSFFFYLFVVYFWLHWVFFAARGLSLVVASGVYSSLQCAGFSLRWLPLRSTGSRRGGFSSCGLQALECRLSSCDARA